LSQADLKRFLVINPFGIGDALFTTPLVRAIKNSYPDSLIAFWCNERVKDVLKNNKNIDKIFALSRGDIKRISQQSRFMGTKKFLGLLSGLKKERFDISFDFSLDHRYSLISKILGIKRRIGFNYKRRGRFLTDKIDIDGYHSKHVVEYYLDLLKFIGVEAKDKNLELSVPDSDKVKIKNILANQGINDKGSIIGIAPGAGASWGQDAALKHWPAVNFAQLADKIINEFKAQVLILGDKQETTIARQVVKAMHNQAIDLAGKTNLDEFMAIIDNLRLLITNDGGPLHIAVALRVKTVSIFGPVDDEVYGPYPASDRHIVVKKDLTCSPCYQRFRLPACSRNRECINSISTERVFEAVRRLW
jgi:heptosyltransferase-2